MGVPLKIFLRKLSGCSGCAIILLVLFGPGILIAYILQSGIWLIVTPLAIFSTVVLSAIVSRKLNPDSGKRIVTPEQFADELDRHLMGTEGKWDWDDITSRRIADERLEQISQSLPRFDSLSNEKDREELRALIAALRRGEIPEVVPPTHLTYK